MRGKYEWRNLKNLFIYHLFFSPYLLHSISLSMFRSFRIRWKARWKRARWKKSTLKRTMGKINFFTQSFALFLLFSSDIVKWAFQLQKQPIFASNLNNLAWGGLQEGLTVNASTTCPQILFKYFVISKRPLYNSRLRKVEMELNFFRKIFFFNFESYWLRG